jgi:long-chain acyl-CoA synthetase
VAVLLADHVAARPDEPALIDAHGTTTWAQLDERVNRLVSALRARGLVEGATVAMMAGNQREAIEVALACMHGGWVMVPVNWHWVAAELAHVLDDSDAAALVVGADWLTVATGAEALVAGAPGRWCGWRHRGRPGAAGYECYEACYGPLPSRPTRSRRRDVLTSGTTGHPRGCGVVYQVGGPAESGSSWPPRWRDHATGPHVTVQLVCGPAYHSAQWVFAVVPLLLGATVVLQHRFDPAEVLALIDRHRVTNVHLVPAQFARLLKLSDDTRDAFSGSSLHRVHHGAAPCPTEVKRQMIAWWGPIITEYYGGTEGGFITVLTAEEWAERPTSVGRPLPTIEVLVVGADGARLGPGEPGDLYFRNLMGIDFEYHKAEAKTEAAHLEPGVGTLGDVGHLDNEGYLFLSDRRIDMVISGGVNIYPAEIEGALAGHPAVVDVAVFGIPHDEMGEQVLAVVVPVDGRSGDEALAAELEAHVRERLAGYKCPRRWEFAADLPRSEAGKLVKRTLRTRTGSATTAI